MLDINARTQRRGNCYYKEIEKGLKYAYSEAFDVFEKMEFLNGEKIEKIKIPKWPISTKEFNRELVNNIKE